MLPIREHSLAQVRQASVHHVPTAENVLEVTIASSLIEDLNTQLAHMAEGMKETMVEKKKISSDIEYLENLSLGEEVSTPDGDKAVIINDEELEALHQMGFKDLELVPTEDNSGYYLEKDDIQTMQGQKDSQLTSLNSDSEMNMIKIQNLVDQRKNLFTLLTNLMASNNDTLMSIIRNMKN